MLKKITALLGDEAKSLLEHICHTVKREDLHLPGPDFIDKILVYSDRPNNVLRNLHSMFDHGRLAGTGYLSILPVDQGIEHSAGASFAPNPIYFDPENIVKLAIEGGYHQTKTADLQRRLQRHCFRQNASKRVPAFDNRSPH